MKNEIKKLREELKAEAASLEGKGGTMESIMKGILLSKSMLSVIGMMFSMLTPSIKEWLDKMALELYAKAKATENPYDDIAAAFLLAMLGVPTPAV